MAAQLPYHLLAFIHAHRLCGERRRASITPPTPHGYRLIELTCACGTKFKGWATPQDADKDDLRSALLAFETGRE
jgi:hypothetical protein